jgi:hypothetical protein
MLAEGANRRLRNVPGLTGLEQEQVMDSLRNLLRERNEAMNNDPGLRDKSFALRDLAGDGKINWAESGLAPLLRLHMERRATDPEHSASISAGCLFKSVVLDDPDYVFLTRRGYRTLRYRRSDAQGDWK